MTLHPQVVSLPTAFAQEKMLPTNKPSWSRTKLCPLLFVIAIPMAACTTGPQARPQVASEEPDLGPSAQETEAAKRYAQEGMPFAVEINSYDAIFDHVLQDGEMPNLRQKFLVPLAKSRYACYIERVRIDAGWGEWLYWTCFVELKGGTSISMQKPGSFYSGDSRHSDGYAKARELALSTLDKMCRRLGGSHEVTRRDYSDLPLSKLSPKTSKYKYFTALLFFGRDQHG